VVLNDSPADCQSRGRARAHAGESPSPIIKETRFVVIDKSRFLRTFIVFQGFLGLKSGFRAASTLFRNPIFSFSWQKYRRAFRVSLRCEKKQKVSRREDLNP